MNVIETCSNGAIGQLLGAECRLTVVHGTDEEQQGHRHFSQDVEIGSRASAQNYQVKMKALPIIHRYGFIAL